MRPRKGARLLTEAHAEIARHEQDRRRERQEPLAAAEERVAVELTEAQEQAVQLVEAAEIEAPSIRGRAHPSTCSDKTGSAVSSTNT